MSYGNMSTKVALVNTALPTGSDTIELYSSVVGATAPHQLVSGGMKLFLLDIAHDEDGTIRVEKSKDRGLTWHTVTTTAITAAVPTTKQAFQLEVFDDFRVLWINGGSDQTVWVVDMCLSNQRAVAP